MKNTLILLLISASFFSSAARAVDSTSIALPAVSAMPTCVTRTSATAGVNVTFTALADTAHGGVLCPGIYNATATCSVFTSSFCGCGGSSCGWTATIALLRATTITLPPIIPGLPSLSLYIPVDVSTNAGHDGCQASHGNICQNQSNVTITMTNFSFDTTKDKEIYAKGWIECGGFHLCTITVTQVKPL